MDAPEDGYQAGYQRPEPLTGDQPGWVEGAPTSGIGQSCAFCGSRDVVWVHPLAGDLVGYEQYGEGHSLPTFWVLCDRCELIYGSGDDDAAVHAMRSSDGWSWVSDEDVAECLRKPLAVFRRADLGSRRLDAEPSGVAEAREQGFVPLREVTGVAGDLGPLWPAEHRLWLDELGPGPGEDEGDEVLDRWLVRSPWPSLSVQQTVGVLWRWVERDPYPHDDEVWKARVLDVFGWSEAEALASASSGS